MNTTFKRLLSLAVALVMVLGLIPVTQLEVKATETATETTPDDTYTKNLEFRAEDGKAYCPACKEWVTWEAITKDFTPDGTGSSSARVSGHTHYYVADPEEGTKGTVKVENGANSTFLLYLSYKSGTNGAENTYSNVCMHLNGNNLEFNGVIWLGGGNFNLMGTGYLSGNYPEKNVATQPYRGSTINVHGYYSYVNLYSGTVKSGTTGPAYSITTLGSSPNRRSTLYPDAKIEGGVRLVGGTFTMEGGEISGGVHMEPYYHNDEDPKKINYTQGEVIFNMNGGKLTGGSAENGGNVRMIGIKNETITSNMTFNMNAGIIENGVATVSGGNVYMATGTKGNVTFNMNGGVIRNGDAASCGGNVYLKGTSSTVKSAFNMKNNSEMTGGEADLGGNLYMYTRTNVVVEKDAKITQKAYEEGDESTCRAGHNLSMVGQSAVLDLYGTISGGYAGIGGSVYATSCTINVKETGKITGGRSVNGGGNLYLEGSATTPTEANSKGKWVKSVTKAILNVDGTIENGYAAGGNGGGNLYSTRIDVSVSKTGKIVGGNAAAKAGGNMYVSGVWTGDGSTKEKAEEHVASNITIKGTVKNGTAKTDGGNLYVGVAGTTNIDGATFEKGVAGGGGGSVMVASSSGSTFKIVNSTFDGGQSGTNGGNLYLSERNYTFTGNTVKNGKAGGTANAYSGGGNMVVGTNNITIQDCTIQDGKSDSSAGNMYISKGKVVTLDNTTVTGGQSLKETTSNTYGGGNIYSSGGTLNVNNNSVISGGSVKSGSGNNIMVIYGATLTINNGTVGSSTDDRIKNSIRVQSSDTINEVVTYSNMTVNNGTVYGSISRGDYKTNTIVIKHGLFSSKSLLNAVVAAPYVVVAEEGGMYSVHNESGTTVTQPSCTEGGYTQHTCAYEGCAGYVDTITEKHTQTHVEPKSATCGAAGNSEYYACSCGKFYSDAACANEIQENSWVLGQKEHSYTGENGVCVNGCEKTYCDNNGHDYKTTYQNDGETHTVIVTCQNDAEDVTTTAGQAHAYENGVCVCGAVEAVETNAAVVDGVKYEKFQDALAAAAAAGKPVQLLNDVAVEGDLVLTDGLVLDLNGKKLTVDGVVLATFTGNKIADTSDNNSGRLVAQISQLRMMDENGQLPVQMGDGIMFVDAASGNGKGSVSGNFQCWIEDGADQALIDALNANKASELALEFQVIVTWGNNALKYTFTDETVALYMQAWQTNAMFLKVIGAEGIEDLQYQSRIVFADDTMAEVVLWASDAVAH